MRKYLVNTPLSNGDKPKVTPGKIVTRDPDDLETQDLVDCKAISLIPDDDADGEVKAVKTPAKK